MKNPSLGGIGVPGLGVVMVGPEILRLGGVLTDEGSLRGGRKLEASLEGEGMTGGLGLEGPGGLTNGLGVLAAGLG